MIELTDSSRGSSFVQNRSCGGSRFEDGAMVFHEKDKLILPSHHNQSLYVTVYVDDVDLKRALIDPCSSSNILP